jgi:outer membrane protein OmpA-like peptidoglycan-associated protein
MVQLKKKVTLKEKRPPQNIGGRDSNRKRILWGAFVALIIFVGATTFFLRNKKKIVDQENLISETNITSGKTENKTKNSVSEKNIVSEDKVSKVAATDSVVNTLPISNSDEEIDNKPPEKQKSTSYSVGNKYLAFQFEYNKNTINEPTEAMLELVKELKSYPEMRILITAYTDNIGSAEFNNNLSNLRAKAIFDFLISEGVKKDRLTYRGMGISNKFDNTTEQGRQKNRRAEFELTN